MKRPRFRISGFKPKFKPDHDFFNDPTGNGIIVEFDGACRGDRTAYGYKIYSLSEVGINGNGPLARGMTSNTAEWCSLKIALLALQKLLNEKEISGDKIMIFGDSQLVIRQLSDAWKTNHRHLLNLKLDCLNILEQINLPWQAIWMSRKHNQEADSLAGAAASHRLQYEPILVK